MVQRQTFSEFDTDALFETHSAVLRRENQALRRRRNLALIFLTPLFFIVALPVTLPLALLTVGLEAPFLSIPWIWQGIHKHFSKRSVAWHDSAWPLLRLLPTLRRLEHLDTLLTLLGELMPEMHLDVQTFVRDVQDHLARRLRYLTTDEALQLSEPARRALVLVVQRRASGKWASSELAVIALLTLAAVADTRAIRAAERLERGHYDEHLREAATEYLRAARR
ncbi:hypothetical protein [Armatimonas rosea]|uniref:Uncharacterized protein n=1 Tax=Armatimonas rosea TaxID=685828 RepID=A0A7W9SPQ7_ARMRO|nr:hypothetical protein [Armatimonas rosea]MBB6050546.1 hypothetical protein [Armatimonas rosea]